MRSEWNECEHQDRGGDYDHRGDLVDRPVCLLGDYVLLAGELGEVRECLEEPGEQEPVAVVPPVVHPGDCLEVVVVPPYRVQGLVEPSYWRSHSEGQLVPPLAGRDPALAYPQAPEGGGGPEPVHQPPDELPLDVRDGEHGEHHGGEDHGADHHGCEESLQRRLDLPEPVLQVEHAPQDDVLGPDSRRQGYGDGRVDVVGG